MELTFKIYAFIVFCGALLGIVTAFLSDWKKGILSAIILIMAMSIGFSFYEYLQNEETKKEQIKKFEFDIFEK